MDHLTSNSVIAALGEGRMVRGSVDQCILLEKRYFFVAPH